MSRTERFVRCVMYYMPLALGLVCAGVAFSEPFMAFMALGFGIQFGWVFTLRSVGELRSWRGES